MDETETAPMSTLRTVTLINHTQDPVRIRQARADVDVVDLTIPAMSRLRHAVTERQAENYVGLVSLVSGVSVLVHPRLDAVRPSTRVSLADLPHGSASFVTFNVNDYVQVRLTDRGRVCLRENYDKLNAAYGGKLPFNHTPPKEDKDGWSRWQAWSLMQDLGPHISMGMKPPFEMTIRVEVERLNDQARRRLIVDFFNLGPISRWDVCDKGRWLTESDLQLHKEAPDQELWALAFERAEQRGELDLMRKYVDAETPNGEVSDSAATGGIEAK